MKANCRTLLRLDTTPPYLAEHPGHGFASAGGLVDPAAKGEERRSASAGGEKNTVVAASLGQMPEEEPSRLVARSITAVAALPKQGAPKT